MNRNGPPRQQMQQQTPKPPPQDAAKEPTWEGEVEEQPDLSKLNEEELEQYNILLEDQAYPFEDKAIELYETNLGRIKDGTYTQWIESSLDRLKILFPTRFSRSGKYEVIFND